MKETVILETVLQALHKKVPKTVTKRSNKTACIAILDNGLAVYGKDNEEVIKFYSRAQTLDQRFIDTRQAQMLSWEHFSVDTALGRGEGIRLFYQQNSLILKWEISLYNDGNVVSQIFLHDENQLTQTRYLAPFVTPYPDGEGQPLFLSLDQKMLVVPYDNDMWLRYESSVPTCGRKSYDVTAIYDEKSLEGLVIGALDFDVWKNAVCWNAHDARSLSAYCGVADAGTHDLCPHTPVCGTWVSSSRFVIFWSQDIRQGMEQYGDLCKAITPPRPWKCEKVPFGWNSYSGLGIGLKLSHWQEAGAFMKTELPNYCDTDGVAYVNLDGAFGLDEEEIKKSIEKMHEQGQKAGWYLNPCNWFPALAMMPAEGTQVTMGDLFLKDSKGDLMPAADGTVPLDVTRPEWTCMIRTQISRLADLGVDYIKFDFLSHGSVEGAHSKPEYTGRMALNHAYHVISDALDKVEREIFVSLSIAPLFPYFLGNARRCCCDAFGHHEDVRYVLNALNFAWWTNGRLYQYNDPDHIPLYLSVIDKREATSIAEARSRYYSGVISGTVMMLSDNFGPEGDSQVIEASRKRAKLIANDARINEIARWGKAFVPVELGDGTTPYYTLSCHGRYFAAVFNFSEETRTLSFNAAKGNLPIKGTFKDVCGQKQMSYETEISVTLDGYDAVILEIFTA